MNEESVNRHKEDEKIIALITKRLDALDKYLEAKFPEEANKLILKIDTNRMEFIDVRDRQEN